MVVEVLKKSTLVLNKKEKILLKKKKKRRKSNKCQVVRGHTYKVSCQLILFIIRPFLPCSKPYDLASVQFFLKLWTKIKENLKQYDLEVENLKKLEK